MITRCAPLCHPHLTNPHQDLTEARANVNKRLEYIRGEMARVDAQIKSLQDKGSARQQEVRLSSGGLRCMDPARGLRRCWQGAVSGER
jgi:hypothetical protein